MCVHFATARGFSPPGVTGICSTKRSHDLISCCQADATLTDSANTRVTQLIYTKNIMSIADKKSHVAKIKLLWLKGQINKNIWKGVKSLLKTHLVRPLVAALLYKDILFPVSWFMFPIYHSDTLSFAPSLSLPIFCHLYAAPCKTTPVWDLWQTT